MSSGLGEEREGRIATASVVPHVLAPEPPAFGLHGELLTRLVLAAFACEQEMDSLHRSIKEALRMHPPLVMLMRYVHEPYSVKTSKGEEYYIEKGSILATSPSFSHRLAHVYPEPAKFDPDRFATPREEDKQKPAAFIGFGHGRHGCMGEIFAYMQIKVIWSLLLRNFDFEMASGPRVLRAASGCRLVLRRARCSHAGGPHADRELGLDGDRAQGRPGPLPPPQAHAHELS